MENTNNNLGYTQNFTRQQEDIGGRPPVFTDTTYGLDTLIIKSGIYLEELKTNVVKGSINQWCNFLGLSRPTLSTYRKRGVRWEHAIDYIKAKLQEENKVIIQALNGNIPLRLLEQLDYESLLEEVEQDFYKDKEHYTY